jgi:penicillin-binding protein 1B
VLIAVAGVLALIGLITIGVFAYYYAQYAKKIEDKLSAGPFARTSRLYAAPEAVRVGDPLTVDDLTALLRQAGYSDSRGSLLGWFNTRPNAVEIFPGPDSFFRQDPFLIRIADGRVNEVLSLRDSMKRNQYLLEPVLVTNLFDRNRQKRRIVRYQDLPPVLVNAVVSVEDKRFFRHAGFDPLRILKAAYVDIREGYHAQGASTLSMQLARGLWLTPEKTWKRKATETLITLHLERTLTKEQIFEYYANNVDMGRRGSFQILGFGEAAQAYFGKDVRRLDLSEAATLAGLIQKPSYTNPVRWPERSRARRNVVLSLMVDNGYISSSQFAEASAEPVRVAAGSVDSNDAPYFVDLVNDWLQDQMAEHDFQNATYRVYTTIDPRLQRDATEAVRAGIQEVDDLIEKRRKKLKNPPPVGVSPQVALVALDAKTGEVRALVGGRNYGLSQLNRAQAKRQPGSIFKPFVYAAAMASALDRSGDRPVITPVTTVVDEPTVFSYDDKQYEPGNFGDKFYGLVTLRTALMKSLNIPAVKVAEMAGYGQVADLARKAGLSNQVGTPAVALGSYDATPLEMAGAYTVFTNSGQWVKPNWVRAVYDREGRPIFEAKPQRRDVMDPRVAYLMVTLMEDVVRGGTGAGVRTRGFLLPAAGKTGSSRDGWFAGFTQRLICVVWVGYDDSTDLKLEGSKAALPVWTEFMKRAHEHRGYRNPLPFNPPEGVVVVNGCQGQREAFIAGSEPVESCGGETRVAAWEDSDTPVAAESAQPPRRVARAETGIRVTPATPAPAPPAPKKGVWNRIRDIFK